MTFDVRAGELHGLIGQNGSGKSTFVKLLSGLHRPDGGGEIRIDGVALRLPVRPRAAAEHGVSVVHQSLGLIDDATVLENMRVGRFRAGRVTRRIDWEAERRAAEDAFGRLGTEIDVSRRAGALSEEERATVAIARALQDRQPGQGLIVFDESTRALTRETLRHFYGLLRTVLDTGSSVLLISHRIEEIVEHADRVTVLRDGEVAAAGLDNAGLTEHDLTRHMLGYELESPPRSRRAGTGAAVADAVLATGHGGPPVRLSLRVGEIVGLTGLLGSGFEEIPYRLAAARPSPGGELVLDGERHDLGRADPAALVEAGVALVPERREAEGLALGLSVLENLTLPRIGRQGSALWAGRAWQVAEAERMIERLGIRPPRADLPVGTLSGGNQQKVQLAKWLAGRPRLLLVHEPTHAVDVGARHDIVVALQELAGDGCPVVVASTDPHELAALCSRVLIFADGQVVEELADAPGVEAIIDATYRRAAAGLAPQ